MATIPLTPTTGEASANPQVTTLLGKGSEFEGKLSFEGTVRVDGKLSGEVFTEDVLIVGEGAEVNAEVSVGSIVIQGTVRGNIVAKRGVEIHTPGRVRGNINTPSLFVEKGVLFDGQCQMEPGGAAPEPPSHRPAGGKASKGGGGSAPPPPSTG
jgi:cytoskeletal protein CcmA (bactofilin family)